jgi:hypothetical protein
MASVRVIKNDARTIAHVNTMYYAKEGLREFRTCLPKVNVLRQTNHPSAKDSKAKCTMARTGRKGGAACAKMGRHEGIMEI